MTGALQTETWLMCGKNPNEADMSTEDLTLILIYLADFYFL